MQAKTRVMRQFGVLVLLLVLLMPRPSVAGDLTRSERQTLVRLAKERDRAARRYVRLWVKGGSAQEQAVAGVAVLAGEAHIGAMLFGEVEELKEYSLLWGRRVDEKRLGVVLMEKLYGLDLNVHQLVTGGEEQ